MFSRISLRAVGALAAGVASVALWWSLSGASTETPNKPSPATIEFGEAIYDEHCASCHGADLEGEPNWKEPLPSGQLPAPPHDETGHTWHHSDRVLFEITKYGPAAVVGEGYESNMPAFEGVLTDEEIRAVLEFIKSTWPEREREFQEHVTRQDQVDK